MQLNKFSDYALRVLMLISKPRDLPYTIAELAEKLHVSQNHLVKIVHFMSKKKWIITLRGKGGGIRLNPKTLELRLGDILKTLEGDSQIVECNHPPCALLKYCGLKGILNNAVDQFYQSLNQYTLAEVLSQPAFHSSKASSTIQLLEL